MGAPKQRFKPGDYVVLTPAAANKYGLSPHTWWCVSGFSRHHDRFNRNHFGYVLYSSLRSEELRIVGSYAVIRARRHEPVFPRDTELRLPPNNYKVFVSRMSKLSSGTVVTPVVRRASRRKP